LAAIIISVDLFSAMSSVNEKAEVDAEAKMEADVDVCASCGKNSYVKVEIDGLAKNQTTPTMGFSRQLSSCNYNIG
jgi:hypothetical protein